jgi:ribosomal protein S6--L-glutamate ligase
MRIYLLSRSPSTYTTRRLAESARARGHQVRILDPLRCELFVEERTTAVYYGGRTLARADLVIPRFGQSATAYGSAVLDQFGLQGMPSLNDSIGIGKARNRLRSLQILAAAGIDVPPTVMTGDAADLGEIVRRVGGLPVLVRLLEAGGRTGVVVFESLQSMSAALETVLGLRQNFIVQRYVKSPRGRDLRALVVGDRVVAAVRRRARAGKVFRSLARGTRSAKVSLSAAQERIAVRSAQTVGLPVAAVDMLETGNSLRVFEVNAAPGLHDLEAITGLDLATPIIELGERKVLALAGSSRKNAIG